MKNSKISYVRPVFLTILLIMVGVVSHMDTLDQRSHKHLDDALQRSLITFTAARTLNGVISVMQGTQMSFGLAGNGPTFSPGEFLDPANDLIERFSMVMLVSSSSLAIQSMLVKMSAWSGIKWMLLAMTIIVIIVLWRQHLNRVNHGNFLIKIFLVFLVMRFTVPLFITLNEHVYDLFLVDDYIESQAQLDRVNEVINISTVKVEQNDISSKSVEKDVPAEISVADKIFSIFDDAVAGMNNVIDDVSEKSNILENLKKEAALINEKISASVRYTVSLIAIFILQTIVFPLLFLWLVVRSVFSARFISYVMTRAEPR